MYLLISHKTCKSIFFYRYESFDFHKQCGTDRWDRLQILVNRLANDQDNFGWVDHFETYFLVVLYFNWAWILKDTFALTKMEIC